MEVRQKPWGQEIVFLDEPEYAMKFLKMNANKSTSMHYHTRKKESMFVLEGEINIQVQVDGCVRHYRFGKEGIMTISPGLKHKINALTDAIIIEVSTQPKDDTTPTADAQLC